ncbi:MAG: DUF4870 domain-containing protein [Micrococcales bacterium]
MPSQEDRIYATLVHAISALGFPFLAPLIGMILLKGRSDFAYQQAKEGMNFQLTVILVFVALCLTIIGIPIALLLGIAAVVVLIFAAVQVFLGRSYRFPMTIRFIK